MTNYMRSRFVRMRKLINRIRKKVTKGKDYSRKEMTVRFRLIMSKSSIRRVLWMKS